MSEFNFQFTLRLPPGQDAEAQLDALFEAGCDDAVAGMGKRGLLGLDFAREASSALDAVTSALRDTKTALPNATLLEVGPDLVGLSDIAMIFGVSRQYARKLMLGVDSAPLPVHTGSADLWRFTTVVDWLIAEGIHVGGVLPDENLRALAEVIARLNRLLGMARYRPILPLDRRIRDEAQKDARLLQSIADTACFA
jgi:hypothetical protein